jgi:hypothetical protein
MMGRPPKKQPMVGWFDPIPLIQTAIRVVMSTVFGEFADKREAFAAANPIDDEALDQASIMRTGMVAGTSGSISSPTWATAGTRLSRSLGCLQDKLGLAVKTFPRVAPHHGWGRVYPPHPRAISRSTDLPLFGMGGTLAEHERRIFMRCRQPRLVCGLRAFFYLFCRRTIRAREGRVDRPGKVIGSKQTQQTRTYLLRLPKAGGVRN